MRPLGRDELVSAFQDRHKEAEQTERKVRETWEALVAKRSGLQVQGWRGLWVAVAPAAEIQVAGIAGAEVAALFRDPALTGNREQGWNFVNPYRSPQLDGQGLTSVRQDVLTVRLTDDGRLTLQVALDSLFWKGSPHGLYPYIIMEQPTALLRLAATIYRDHLVSHAADDAMVVGDLALLGIEGWTLGSRWTVGAGIRIRDEGETPGADVTRERPFQWRMGHLRDHPDRCAWQMMAWLFRAFGFPETMIPGVFDPKRGLVIQDR
jgi:hypothetical protein